MTDTYVSSEWQEGDPCEVCGEPEGSGDDGFAEFAEPLQGGGYRGWVVHGMCGFDRGWKLA